MKACPHCSTGSEGEGVYCLNRGKSRALWGEGRMGECDKVFEDERNDGRKSKKRRRGRGGYGVSREEGQPLLL